LKVELGGKTVEIDVEVIDGNLDYNILLGRPWIYAMAAVVSTYFRKMHFLLKEELRSSTNKTSFLMVCKLQGAFP